MTVHFPDLALRFVDERLVGHAGGRWELTTRPSYDPKRRLYMIHSELRQPGRTITGWFRIGDDVVEAIEADGDLRVFALREIRKYLDRSTLDDDFLLDLPCAIS